MKKPITQLPSSVLRREVDELKNRVRLLESAHEQRSKVDMAMVEKYNELRNLTERAMILLAKKEAEWEIKIRDLTAKKDA